jgi:excisionase family DNA binding protein
MDSEVLTVAEAAKLLSVDRKVIYAMIADGLPHQRIGRRIIRIRRDELLAFGRKTAAA